MTVVNDEQTTEGIKKERKTYVELTEIKTQQCKTSGINESKPKRGTYISKNLQT